MVADASIYSLMRQPQPGPGPLEQYAQAQTVRNLMQGGQLQDLQLRQGQKAIDDDAAVSAAYRESGGDPMKLRDILYGRGLHKQAAAAEQAALDAQVKRADLTHKGAQTDKVKAETFTANTKLLRDQLAQVQDDAALSRLRDDTMRLFGMKAAQGIPMTVSDTNFAAWRSNNLMTADDLLKRMNPELKMTDIGGRVVPVNPYTGAQQGAGIAKSAAPQNPTWDSERGAFIMPPSAQSAPVGGAAPSNAGGPRAVVPEGLPPRQDKFGDPKEVTGPDGKPRLVMQNQRTGELVDANTRQPVQGVGPKIGETAQKQLTGVKTTKDAITEYRNALKNWGATDIVKPDARAKMGTFYNNMMLQAKEAYNLGVLNGPDYMILQQVITSPASLTGGITSKEALDAQAKQLDDILTRIGQQVTATQSGIGAPPATPTPAQPRPQPTRAEIDAELRRRGVTR
jgi:hypothetical protein